ncbi:MAG: PaaI family thioesterase [Myxococcaceae bacterium]
MGGPFPPPSRAKKALGIRFDVRASFARQAMMSLLQATVERVAPGQVDIALPVRPELSQQHGFVHAGVVTAIVDTACGYAALTLIPAGTGVLTVEFKMNL